MATNTDERPLCRICGSPLTLYRGSWFGPGDDTRCALGGANDPRHEPAVAVASQRPRLASDVVTSLRDGKAIAAANWNRRDGEPLLTQEAALKIAAMIERGDLWPDAATSTASTSGDTGAADVLTFRVHAAVVAWLDSDPTVAPLLGGGADARANAHGRLLKVISAAIHTPQALGLDTAATRGEQLTVDDLLKRAHALWMIIDNIDSCDDSAKEDDAMFRRMVMRRVGERHQHFTCDDRDVLTPVLRPTQPQPASPFEPPRVLGMSTGYAIGDGNDPPETRLARGLTCLLDFTPRGFDSPCTCNVAGADTANCPHHGDAAP